MIFYEAPHKLTATLSDLVEVFGCERKVSLCRELSKLHEEVIRTTLGEAAARYREEEPRGEFVLVVEGAPLSEREEHTLEEGLLLVERYRQEGLSLKEASRLASAETGQNRKALYDAALKREEKEA